MTHKMRSTFVVSASTRTRVAVAGAIVSAAIISGGPAAAAEARGRAQTITAEVQQFIYSPWAKFCGRGSLGGREVCFTGKEGRTKDGQTVIAASLIEPAGEPKLLRVLLPGLPQPRSVRIIIDMEPAIGGAVTCSSNACSVDYEATPELIDKLKKGQMLQIQAGSIIPFLLPLAESTGNSFARANEGPPTDPKVFKEQQQKKRCPLCKVIAQKGFFRE
jgi:invasion protein IalB